MFLQKLFLGLLLFISMPLYTTPYTISNETDLENSIKNIEKEDIALAEAIYTFIVTNKTQLNHAPLKQQLLEAEHKLTKQNYKQTNDTSPILMGLAIGYCVCSFFILAYKCGCCTHKEEAYADAEYFSIAKVLLLFSTGLSIAKYFKNKPSQELEGKIFFIKMSRQLLERY